MKTTLLTTAAIFVTAVTFGQTKNASDYFPFKENAKYKYQSLGVNKQGKTSEMSYHCWLVKNESGTVKGFFYHNTYWGWQGEENYQVKGNTIQLTYMKVASGDGHINPPRTILKLPVGNSKIEWTGGGNKYSAEYATNVKTKYKTYNDCIVVTEGANLENLTPQLLEMIGSSNKKKYYAKDIGIVKIESYSSNGNINESMSFELVKID